LSEKWTKTHLQQYRILKKFSGVIRSPDPRSKRGERKGMEGNGRREGETGGTEGEELGREACPGLLKLKSGNPTAASLDSLPVNKCILYVAAVSSVDVLYNRPNTSTDIESDAN
jgi:hypothetical protein